MNILIVHNRYQRAGGEDRVADAQSELFESKGHQVQSLFVHNSIITGISGRAVAAASTLYSFRGRRLIRQAIERGCPDIVHVHNTFPLLSPSIFDELRRHKIPSVVTFHNFRALCPTGTLYFKNKIIDRSITEHSWWTIGTKAYRGSIFETTLLSLSIELHRSLGTWWRKPDRLILLTRHARAVFHRGGFPLDKMVVVPNFSHPPPPAPPKSTCRFGALYVGRLSEEKGLELLIDAWRDIDYPLTVIGDGPLLETLRGLSPSNVLFLGAQPPSVVYSHMQSSRFIIVPSLWYEMFPMTVVEAFSCGLPVIASKIGGLAEIIEHEKTGLLFERASRKQLIFSTRQLISDPKLCDRLGAAARKTWNSLYSPNAGYSNLMSVYENVLSQKAAGSL